ncbi:MAG TPA: hypothetical protein VMS22_01435 [Candidatus Eisenbacteria bacterium]|nr:hypothetical protein [Candidatus Eisenbacteria bacterium]
MTTRTFGWPRRALVALVAAGALATSGVPATAQLSHPTLTNSSNPNELVAGTASTPSRERESVVDVVSSAAGAFVTRYVSLVTVDSDGAGSSAGIEPLTSDYQIDFTATAPGAYVLTVDTALSGDLHLVNDGPGSAVADVSGITGLLTGGTLTSGSLDLADPGSASGAAGGAVAISDMGSATVFGVSNGGPVAHSLRFVFTQSTTTTSGGGDEAAIRLGGTSDVSTETAGDYPGSPARTQADDGHFVTVTITSLCGNSVIDSGPSYTEACDDGPANGTPGSCCNTDCTAVTSGTPCSADPNPCTVDVCNGAGACTHNAGNEGVSCDDGNACTSGETCTSGVCAGGTTQTCPLCETCDAGMGCVEGPRTNCKLPTVPLKSKFQMKKGPTDTNDLVQYKWVKGAATNTVDFGQPDTTDDYALCVYAPGLVLKATAPAGGLCGTKACWKTLSIKGFSYKDPLRDPLGVDKIVLKAGLAGKAKVQMKGKGSNLPALPLSLTLPAIVQLQSENGQCWGATFSPAGQIINDGTQFKGKSD